MADEDVKKLQEENKALQSKIEQLTSEKGKVETEKAIAEAQKATAEAQRAVILARAPASETKALEGKVTADATVVTGLQRQSYKALDKVAAKMADNILANWPSLSVVMLYNERDLTAFAHYRIVENELRLLRDGYAEALAKEGNAQEAFAPQMAMPALLAPAVAGAALKSVVDVIALFRTDVDYKGAAVTFDEASLAAEVAKHLKRAASDVARRGQLGSGESEGDGERRETGSRSGLEVIYSALSVPGLFDTAGGGKSELLETLGSAGALREEAGVEIAAFDALDAAAKTSAPNKVKIARLKALNARYDRLLKGVGEIEDKTNLTALTTLLRGEMLGKKMKGGESAILFVKAMGGGENKTTRSLWRGGRLYHSGTAVLTYLLFSPRGELFLSDVLAETTLFVEAK